MLSSLPYLTLFEQPGITREKFLLCCSSYFHGKRMELLERLSLVPGDPDARELLLRFPDKSVSRAYACWESALRVSLAKIRAAKNPGGVFPDRPDAEYETDADTAARRAYAASDPLERERILDRARWEKLDELTRMGHSHVFNFDSVCAYCLKLQIAEKWAERKEAGAEVNLDRAADAVRKNRIEPKENTEQQK